MEFNGVEFDPEELRKRYEEESAKRFRADGKAQYIATKGEFVYYEQDPYTQKVERQPVNRQVDVAILGGGFGGMLAAARLIESGISNILIIEKGGDFGGTWYWNRYPGAACDVESYIYLPLLEETGYTPKEKYASAPEIVEHNQRIGRHYGLYERALFQTEISELRWNEEDAIWHVHTDRNDRILARSFIVASGPLQEPKLPGIKGIDQFKGHSFHTSRWHYDYTKGDSNGGLTGLQDKRVGIIGTGATAIQCVPHLGQWSKDLYVFQRTPSGINVRNDHPTDPQWAASLKPGWQRERMDNYTRIMSGLPVEVDLVNDSWTRPVHEMLSVVPKDAPPEKIAEVLQLADYRAQQIVRNRVDEVVQDPKTAELLKPWYNRMCKRPTFHDGYLQTFNRPNVHLVDTNGGGVDEITEDSVIVGDNAYQVNCLIFATGFELAAYSGRESMPIYGKGGLELAEKWKDGATTLHGMTVHGFPNLFILSTTQSAWGPNFPHMMAEQATHIAYIISEMHKRGAQSVEVTAEAEQAWVDHHLELAPLVINRWTSNCPPSFWNEEGKASSRTLRNGPYGHGVPAMVAIIEAWRAAGDLNGLVIKGS